MSGPAAGERGSRSGSAARWRGRRLRVRRAQQELAAAAGRAQRRVPSSRGAGQREEPSAATASSGRRPLLCPASCVPSARPPAQSAALGPAEPGGLSGRRRLSATLASRGARRPGTSATPGTPLCPALPPPPVVAGTLRPAPPGPSFSSSPRRRSGESRAAAPGASERAEAPAPECRGWRRRRRRRREVRVIPGRRVFHLQAEAAVASCIKAAVAAGAGLPGLSGHGEKIRTRGR